MADQNKNKKNPNFFLPKVFCSIKLKVHSNGGIILGHHLGFGDKPTCNNLVITTPENCKVDDLIKNHY